MSRCIGAMPQLVQATIFSLATYLQRFADHGRDLGCGLDLVGGNVDDADQHVLAVKQLEHAHRYARIDAFERDLVEAAARQRRKELLILPPLGPERRFPLDIGGNAVAVADVHRAGGGDAFDGAMQRLDSPSGGVVHVDVEGRLVELDHVDAVGGKSARFLVEQRRKGHRHLHSVAVVSVGNGVDDGHRAGQGEFQLSVRMSAGEPGFAGMHARAKTQRADHGRTHRFVTIVADAHLDAPVEVDALDRLEEAVHEMLARLLAVADDIDAGILLQLKGEQRRVILGGFQRGAFKLPRRP